MPKQKPDPTLPDDWLLGKRNSLRVVDDLGFPSRGIPDGLSIQRINGTCNLQASYLPLEEDDPRNAGGGAKGGKKRRIRRRSSTRTNDPYEAARKAVAWAKQDLLDLKTEKKEQAQQEERSLFHYWETWFSRECKRRQNRNGFTKWKRENIRLWSSEEYGIKNQPFAKKAVEEITYADFVEYWAALDARKLSRENSTDGGATKKELKTLINHLLKEARENDNPRLILPEFPRIAHQKHERDHFTSKEWGELMRKLIELSDGAAVEDLTQHEYKNLQFSKNDRKNQRNWVDLYDALCAMWFWHLRSEDIPRLKTEWFIAGQRDDQVLFRPEILKGDRPLLQTENARPDGFKVWQRIKKRKPNGYLVFPHLIRPDGDPVRSAVQANVRFLFKNLKSYIKPPITRKNMAPKQVRHTAFRLLVEEDFSYYSTAEGIAFLAHCGNTSRKELMEKYLEPVRREIEADAGRKRLSHADWSFLSGRVKIT